MEFDNLLNKIIGLAADVHKELGTGLLESTYRRNLSYKLNKARIKFQAEAGLPVKYNRLDIPFGYRIDFLIDRQLIVELKCMNVDYLVHKAKLLTYMKLAKIEIGLLINFNETVLKDGLQRFIL